MSELENCAECWAAWLQLRKAARQTDSVEYLRGYAAGKEKAHFEVRNILDAGHDAGCGCEPCVTVRILLTARRQRALPQAADPRGLDGEFPGGEEYQRTGNPADY